MNNAFYYETDIGKIGIAEDGEAITHIFFKEITLEDIIISETSLLRKAYEEIQEYFLGKRKNFDLPLKPQGTEFQQRVWKVLQEIPYGSTCSYKDIAKQIGNIKASRAVGMANNKNPIPIIIPCHRVVGADGKLVGYAGGLDVKKRLLDIEKEN